MTLEARCANCRATFPKASFLERNAESARAMVDRFKSTHVEGSPGHEVIITETPTRKESQ